MDLRMTDGIVHAERVGSWRRSRRLRPAGRVCAMPGCTTILSTYNASPRCSLHGFGVQHGAGHRVHRSGSVDGTDRAA